MRKGKAESAGLENLETPRFVGRKANESKEWEGNSGGEMTSE